MWYMPSRSVQLCNARDSWKRRAVASSSAAGAHVVWRHRSRKPFERPDERASPTTALPAAGSNVAVAVISPVWASDSSPAPNAAAVAGSASSSRAVCSDRVAAPTLTPVVEANQCAAERCPSRFHANDDSTRRAANPRPATASRSHRVNRSTSDLAPVASRVPGSRSATARSNTPAAPRTSSNTPTRTHLPERPAQTTSQPGKCSRQPTRTYVR